MKHVLLTGGIILQALYACAQTGSVADYTKISETKGNLNTPLTNQGMFGFLSETLSENKLISGAPHDGNGAFYLIELDEGGAAGNTVKISTGDFTYFDALSGSEFGTAALELQDRNNDGKPDYIVGAPGIQPSGALFLLLSESDGFNLSVLNLPVEMAEALEVGTHLAQETGNIYIPSTTDAGSIHVCSISAANELVYKEKIGINNPLLSEKLDDEDRFGSGLSFADMNGDGFTDIICGAPGDDDLSTNYGAVYILYRDGVSQITGIQKLSRLEGDFNGFMNLDDEFGISVRCIGDLDENGVPDLAVGAPGDDDGGIDIGAVWILFMRPDGTVKNHKKINRLEGNFGGDLNHDDRFGMRIALIGDHNNDGTIDIAVGTVRDDDGGSNKGALYCIMIERCPSPSGFFDYEDNNGVVSFTAEGGPGYSHIWNFDDGGYSQVQNPTHTYENSGTYWVCLAINSACGGNNFCQNVTVSISSTVSVEDRIAKHTVIYPNPSTNFIKIETEGKIESIRFVNITGQESLRYDNTKPGEKIDISSLPNGVYIAEIIIDGNRIAKRIQKVGI